MTAIAWTADSEVVTADSPYFTASGYGGPPISSPQFPNVPQLPGVPPLARLTTAAATAAAATLQGTSQALATQLGLPLDVTFGTNALYAGLGLQPLSSQSQSSSPDANPSAPSSALPSYGITGADGTLIINPDSAVEVEVGADSDLNSHPVENGGFQDFNRVQQPISIRMLLACQGRNMTRASFLATLESLRENTFIVTVSVPDATYPNMVLKGYGYKKTAERGAVTIWADTQWLEERSTNVTVSAPPTAQPQGASTSSLGALAADAPTSAQAASILNPPVPPSSLPLFYANTAPPSGVAF